MEGFTKSGGGGSNVLYLLNQNLLAGSQAPTVSQNIYLTHSDANAYNPHSKPASTKPVRGLYCRQRPQSQKPTKTRL
jgi:hypothetical protein